MIKKISATILLFTFLVVPFLPDREVEAATFEFAPASDSYPSGCTRELQIFADMQGDESNAADFFASYDPSEIEILDANNSQPGIQIVPGNAYQTFVNNQVDDTNGTISATAISIGSNATGRRLFASIRFRSIGDTPSTSLSIQFDGVGNTRDSNIAEASTSLDILTDVTNGTFTFFEGPCNADRQAPRVNWIDPVFAQEIVDIDQNAIIRITDNQSGVDLDSLEFNINGVVYTIENSELTYTGSALNYTFNIDPADDFLVDDADVIIVTGADLAGNRFNAKNTFDIPPLICDPDSIINEEVSVSNIEILQIEEVEEVLGDTFLNETVVEEVILESVDTFGTIGAVGITFYTLFLIPFVFIVFIKKDSKNKWVNNVKSITPFVLTAGLTISVIGYFISPNVYNALVIGAYLTTVLLWMYMMQRRGSENGVGTPEFQAPYKPAL